MSQSLTLMPGIAEAIRNHGVETYPNECCGALIGTEGVVHNIAALPNVTDEGARRRFRVSDTDYRFVEGEARRLQQDLLGFYHSHPDHPARPSQYDLDHAFPFFWYVIVSIQQARPDAMTVWLLAEDRSEFREALLTQQ